MEPSSRTTPTSARGFRTFDAPGDEFKLALETLRVSRAHLFDPMMALHTSSIAPLPHQVNAVYEVMLRQQPLRFVLADDPGAGKTIMAGLLLKEMLLRGEAKRVLIVAPGSLTEQWQNELDEKLGVRCETFSSGNARDPSGNHFANHDLLIARLDQLARNQSYQRQLQEVSWDLIIIDEAHKLTASYQGRTVSKTQRFRLAEMLSRTCRHFLLITATPHNGKEEDFQLFLSLLDPDRFSGRYRANSPGADISDVLHRTVKENLRDLEGNRLLPDRHAYTATYDLSSEEAVLYSRVTGYVRTEMSRADRLGGRRREAVGFALTLLQRRLASSPAALYRSLQRRRLRLEQYIGQLPAEGLDTPPWDTAGYAQFPGDLDEAADELAPDEYERLAEQIVDEATAASSRVEVEAEITALLSLENQTQELLGNGTDRKWDELSRLLRDRLNLLDGSGRSRKLIIFTEHRDTLYYLLPRIRTVLGTTGSAVAIHGGLSREDRRRAQESFSSDPEIRVLIATDAAGEGVNLQCASVMVNFDLPWNPNRLEQRFGRIHRIGQTESCHLWNLVARGTLEGEVFETLFAKLDIARSSLGGRVFDVLGQAFENRSLESLLRETIREGKQREARGQLEQALAKALDTEHLQRMLKRISPAEEPELQALKGKLATAANNALSPEFIRSFLGRALAYLGGEMTALGDGHFRIPTVPVAIREFDRPNGERRPLVLRRYERICFEEKPASIGNAPAAEMVHPAHPLVRTCADMLLDRLRPCLERGSVLVGNDGEAPGVVMVLEHSIYCDLPHPQPPISQRIQLVRCSRDGSAIELSWSDLFGMRPSPRADAQPTDTWPLLEVEALSARAAESMSKEHLKEVESRLTRLAERRTVALRKQMLEEIDLWSRRYLDLRLRPAGNRQPVMQEESARGLAEALSQRLQVREEEVAATLSIVTGTPTVLGIAMIATPDFLPAENEQSFCANAAARGRIEHLAMQAVIEAERALGHIVHDVSAEKCGWDITALPHSPGDPDCVERRIEVKGRAKGQSTITVTRNEISQALNHADKFILAVALVAPDDQVEGPYYIREPFSQKPDWAEASRNLDLDLLLMRSISPQESV